jgi:hypothetical protein
MVLRSAGGLAVAIPFLPSLAPRSRAGGSLLAPKRYVSLITGHGGAWGSNMYPADTVLTEQESYVGHTIRRGTMTATDDGTLRAISPVLSAAATSLTPELVAKMSILRGLDIPFYISHHSGGCNGNYWDTTNTEVQPNLVPRPTIDQVVAWSEAFYGGPASVLTRTLVIEQSYSYGWSDPLAGQGEVQRLPASQSNLDLFEQVFIEPDPSEPEVDPRPLVVDRLLAQYKSLRESDRRLSAADRTRLDEHWSRLDELQRRLTTAVTCTDVEPPTADTWPLVSAPDFITNNMAQREYWALMNDIVVTAFLCDTCRVAAIGKDGPFFAQGSTFADWHQDIAHRAQEQGHTAQADLVAGFQQMFEFMFLDLMRKLDIDDPLGGNLLDNTLMVWQQESGWFTHDSLSIPIVTAGSAGGSWVMGQYVDFRNRDIDVREDYEQSVAPTDPPAAELAKHPGLFHAQLLGTILDALGLPRETWEVPSGGYGDPFQEPRGPDGFVHPASHETARREPLPGVLT